jgi:putative ABC transport system substrate-binding protein
MYRNGFVAFVFVAVGTLTCPLPLHAQQQIPVVGFLTSGSLGALNKKWAAAFHSGLGEAGYVEGQNVRIDYRAADDQYDRLPGLAADLVRARVAVIVAAGGPVSALAARRATDTVPIVFTTIADPVKSGLVDGMSRPGGNVTGTAGLTSELDPKRLELLHEIKPDAHVLGALVNPNRPGVEANNRELQASAQAIGRRLIIENAGPSPGHDLDAGFAKLAEQKIEALVVTADPFYNFRRKQVIALAARYNIPAVYQWREFVEDGGLMSYGPSIAEAYKQAGIYAGQIIKGAKPAELPVMQPTKFEFVINQKTAKTLGIEIPPLVLARATEVTE